MRHPFAPILAGVLLISGLLLPGTSCAAGMAAAVTPETAPQGGHLKVSAETGENEPELLFMGRMWRMFRQDDGSWQALLPVENLTKPGTYTVMVRSAEMQEAFIVTVSDNGRAIQHITLPPSKSGIRATAREKELVKEAIKVLSTEKRYAEPLDRPCKGETSSLFGLKRSYNGGPVTSYHKGLDIAAPAGTPVLAPAAGTVALTGTVAEGFAIHGNTVVVDHGQGLTSIYLHLDSISVKPGQEVQRGDELGRVGDTGISTAPHLHWGTYLYGISVDPEGFTKAK